MARRARTDSDRDCQFQQAISGNIGFKRMFFGKIYGIIDWPYQLSNSS